MYNYYTELKRKQDIAIRQKQEEMNNRLKKKRQSKTIIRLFNR